MHTTDVVELKLRVIERRTVAEDVVELVLAAPDGADLPAWEPGAHIDLILEPGVERQYSLCGDPAARARWRVAVLREPDGRGGSRRVHDQVAVDDLVVVRGARNHFSFLAAPRYLFIAGGIGITPMLPMIAHAEATGAQWTLHYGGRSRGSMAYLDELLTRYPDHITAWPQDEAGLPDLDAILAEPSGDRLIYSCGPEGLLTAIEARIGHWTAGALHVERFRPKAADPDAVDTEFEVELAQTGSTITVPIGCSILEAVRAAGVDVLSSCEEGTCGTCETDVLDGEPEHRDSLLTEEERASNETMLICVSRCAGRRLVLDL